MTHLWVIGDGEHAKVIIDAVKLQGRYLLGGLLSDSPTNSPVEPHLLHIGPISHILVEQMGVEAVIIGIGDNKVRARIATQLDSIVTWISIVHPSAVVAQTATIGEGAFLAAGSIIQPSASIGAHAIINTGATVDHDCVVGAFSHVAPGCHLAGRVKVGEGALLGIGASVIPNITIGRNAIIGAGSVVIRDVPDGAKMAGNPAKLIR